MTDKTRFSNVSDHSKPRFAYAEKEGRNFLERSARPAAVRVP